MAKDLFTGLTVRDRTVQWVCVKQARDSVSVVDSRSAPLDPAAETEPDPALIDEKDRASLSSRLRTCCGRVKGPLSIGMSPAHVLLRVLDLPSANPQELAGMVELQADKLSPFPAENTVFSHEVLSVTESSSKVAVAITQKKLVDSVGAVFKGAGLLPHRLDVETLGWLHLLTDAGAIDKAGCTMIVLKDMSACDIIVTRDGAPVAFRTAGRSADLADADLCSELEYTLTALESEPGMDSIRRVDFWHWGARAEETGRAIHEKLGLEIQLHSFESLPPLAEGLARRAATQGSDGIDLAPEEWLRAERRLLARKRLVLATVVMLAAWVAGVAGLFLGGRWQEMRLEKLQAKEKAMQAPSRKAQKTRQLLLMTEQYTNRTSAAIECLREVTLLKPDDVEFSLFKYTSEKGKNVNLQGQAAAANSVLDFADSLERSPLFSNMRLTGPKATGQDKYTFSISLDVPEGAE